VPTLMSATPCSPRSLNSPMSDSKKIDDQAKERLTVQLSSLPEGTQWAAFMNKALDSAARGHMRFLAVGPGCTYKDPPDRYPDTETTIGWKYRYIGMVHLDTGVIQ